MKLIRVSQAKNLPIAKSTLYKWHHLGLYPNLFVKFRNFLFLDLEELDKLLGGKMGPWEVAGRRF